MRNTVKNTINSRAVKSGKLQRVRRGFYVPADEFYSPEQAACEAIKDGVLRYHGAMAYYGLSNMVSYEIYIASTKRFRTFEFGSTRVVWVPLEPGVRTATFTHDGHMVKVTTIEQTLVDCIANPLHSGGFEEIQNALEDYRALHNNQLDFMTMAAILEEKNNKSLWQRTGYLMSYNRLSLSVPDSFIELCKERSRGVVSNIARPVERGTYIPEFKITVPDYLADNYKLQ